MTAVLSPMAVVVFLAAVAAAHLIYFHACPLGDSRLRICLPPLPDPTLDHLATLAARSPPGSIAPEYLMLPSVLQSDEDALASTALEADDATSRKPADGRRAHNRIVMGENLLVLEGAAPDRQLVCCGDVEIRPCAVISSSIKVRGNLEVGANVTFLDSVIVNGNLRTGENCVFMLHLIAKGRVAQGRGTRFGGTRIVRGDNEAEVSHGSTRSNVG
jgi:hypothetical protein